MEIKSLNTAARLAISALCLSVLYGILYAGMTISLSTTGQVAQIPSLATVQQKYAGIAIVSAMRGSMYDHVSDDDYIEVVKDWVESGATQAHYDTDIEPIMSEDCSDCHSASSTMTDAMTSMPLTTYDEVKTLTKKGIPWNKLAVETHTHLFSIGMMAFILGILISMTGVLTWIKHVLICAAFLGLWGDVLFWTLAKFVSFVGYLIPLTGGLLISTIAAMSIVVLLDCWTRVPWISKRENS
ncbi:hypothetical protein [Moritella sp. Urea-trap-13]|uniref:hypothetical protein n=1 Tax=Moritella sp. Urea-trap-13 TaxID=2058327 RepID=UPI000C345605|nr:hypothetical protein [Moritella sp. Urea-trap-13]PKH06069.1 hypothetical protein CXF93_09030 [Moritella sp. Urea-trap-13]